MENKEIGKCSENLQRKNLERTRQIKKAPTR
jgi:hypothetical protein